MPDFGKRKLLSHFTDRKCRAYHPPLHSRCLRPSRYCGALPTRTPPHTLLDLPGEAEDRNLNHLLNEKQKHHLVYMLQLFCKCP